MHYVIGDIHGQLTALKLLLTKLNWDPAQDSLTFVGDLVDWGPESIPALLFVMELQRSGSAEVLLGNHDLMMRQVIAEDTAQLDVLSGEHVWALNRGDVTLRQYLELEPAVRREILDWLNARPVEQHLQLGETVFCICHSIPLAAARQCCARYDNNPEIAAVWHRLYHGGIDPTWGDETLVRGHSITKSRQVDFYDRCIDIDCGAKCMHIDTLEQADGDADFLERCHQSQLAALCLETLQPYYVTQQELLPLLNRTQAGENA